MSMPIPEFTPGNRFQHHCRDIIYQLRDLGRLRASTLPTIRWNLNSTQPCSAGLNVTCWAQKYQAGIGCYVICLTLSS